MSGKNPLGQTKEPQSYEGINMNIPVGGWGFERAKRDPTTNDKKFPVGMLWLNTVTDTLWIMVAGNGTWEQIASNGSSFVLTVANGGTGVSSLTAHGVVIGEGTSPVDVTSAGTSGQLLQSGGASADPNWTTSTYPSTNAINTLLYASAANTMSALATANDGVLVTGATGTPSILAGPGTTGQVLQANSAAAPSFSTASYPSTTTANQLLYSSATNTVGGLATANNGTLVTSTAGVPSIQALGNGQVLIGQGASTSPASVFISNARNTYVPTFNALPVMSASTGGTAAVTINTYNVWAEPQWGAYFEQYNTTVASNIAPAMSATAGNGLNLDNIGAGNAKSIEITEGNTVNTKNAFVIGTSAAFFVKAGFSIATLADIADVYVGFRKVQTYQATLPTGYTDYAVIGVHSTAGAVELQTQVGSGGNTLTNTTNTVSAATIFTVQVNVSATGVVTYLFNGSAPTTVAAYTFTSALTVVPYIIYTSAAGAHAEVDLVSYQCGFQ